MTYFLIVVIIGGFAGWIASMILGEDWRYGILANIALGIIGAVLASLISGSLGGPTFTGFNVTSFFVSLVGALALILLGRALRREGRGW